MESTATLAQKNRLSLLDCIRALAVIMVLIYHVGVELGSAPGPMSEWFYRRGLLGVDIFFPLSGFLITSFLLTRYSKSDIRTFFLRRFFRIVPLYMVALLVYALACVATGTNLDTLHSLWKNALFLTGWDIFHGERALVPYTITWSLSVEEFAYIIIGLGALFLRGRIVWLLLAMTLGALALRYSINLAGYKDVYFYPPARLDSVALGGLTAWAGMRGKPVLIPLLILLGVTLYAMQFGRVPYHTLIYLAICLATCLVMHTIVVHLPRVDTPIVNGIASIGFYSYFIYLFHYFNIGVLALIESRTILNFGFWGIVVLALILTYIQAWLSFRFFEGPMMAFGRRLEKRRSASGPMSPIQEKLSD